jgi:hypothetical protein
MGETMRLMLAALLVLGPGAASVPRPGAPAAAPHATSMRQSDLVARNRSFLEAVRSHQPNRMAAFFPKHGTFEYVFTEHRPDGNHKRSRRFPARSARREIEDGDLWESFDIQYESQPVGLFAHQVMIRGTEWRSIGGTRFAPPGEGAASAIFVEWRREGSTWVVSAFGDERYSGVAVPSWCCRVGAR